MQVARRTEMITDIESRAEPLMKHRRALRPTLSGVAPPVPETQKISDQRPGNVYNATSFDTNVVIIMAALLCVLICALGINSVVRCALRCTRRMAFESPEDVAVRLANTGMKKNAVKALPTVVYGKGDSGAQTGSECPICLGEFADGENMRVLPKCNHGFHVKCIDTWLVSHSSCPTCRHSLLSIAEKRSKVATIEILATPVGAGQPASWRMQEPHSQCVETRIYRFPPPEPPENAGDRAIDGCELPPVGRAAEGCSSMLAADDDREEGISPAKEGRLAVAGTSQH